MAATGKVKHNREPVQFRAYGADTIARRIARMVSYTRAVRRGNDPDAVHDMRVASRRLRAALNVFQTAFDDPMYVKLQKEVRQVTGALSLARDLDVMIAGLQKDAAYLPTGQRGVISEVLREWMSRRREAQGSVVAALDRLAAFDPAAVFAAVCRTVTAPEDTALDTGAHPDAETRAAKTDGKRGAGT